MKQQSPDSAVMLDALRRAVSEALEKKRVLGQYAVFWEKGEIQVEGEDSPVIYGYPKADSTRSFGIIEDND